MSIIMGITQSELMQIISADGNKVSTNLKGYINANHDKYKVLVNTWLLLCYDIAGSRAHRVLRNAILRDGLLSVIDACSTLASDIVRSDFSITPNSPFSALFVEDERLTLQLLRYPKRFSPAGADKLLANGISAFLAVNARCKGRAHRVDGNGAVLERTLDFPKFLVDRVRDYCHSLLWADISDEDPLLYGSFSNGATADGCHTLYEKYRAFSKHASCYKHVLYPIQGFVTNDPKPDLDYVKVVGVPKSYKTPRLIAEVAAYTQYHMQGIRKCAIECISRSHYSELITLDDQSVNAEWSRLGSVYGTYCTLDLSNASDSISDHLAKQVLPVSWFRVIDAWNPPFLMVNGKKMRRWIFLTSGSGDTFVMESVIFLAISLTATEYASIFYQDTLLPPRVYGDDILCDVRAYDTLVDFLGMLRFSVNTDKSFSIDSNYRESCGAEWWCGLDTATKYFPRRAFDEQSPEYLEGLISLQHRLVEFQSADEWLVSHIRALAPRFGVKVLTSSYVGIECDDLWEEYPYFKVVNPPFDHSKMVCAPDGIRREAHTALVAAPRRELQQWLRKDRPLIFHRPIVPQDIALCEMFRYVDFLQHGQSFDEYGIPIHRQSISEDLVKPSLRYATIIR